MKIISRQVVDINRTVNSKASRIEYWKNSSEGTKLHATAPDTIIQL
jgi:hypothetical protein